MVPKSERFIFPSKFLKYGVHENETDGRPNIKMRQKNKSTPSIITSIVLGVDVPSDTHLPMLGGWWVEGSGSVGMLELELASPLRETENSYRFC